MLDEALVASVLQWYVNGFNERSGMRMRLEIDRRAVEGPLRVKSKERPVRWRPAGNTARIAASRPARCVAGMAQFWRVDEVAEAHPNSLGSKRNDGSYWVPAPNLCPRCRLPGTRFGAVART